MPTNQKIKSITVNQDRINEIVSKANPMELAQLAHFAEKAPHLIQIEYEKPKSNVLFAVEKPEMEQSYCYIDSDGEVAYSGWTNSRIDNLIFYLNNVFLTKENAQKQADRNQLIANIERFACENNDEIDWNGANGVYRLIFSHQGKEWTFKYSPTWQSITTCFSSETIATQALEKFRDRLYILLD